MKFFQQLRCVRKNDTIYWDWPLKKLLYQKIFAIEQAEGKPSLDIASK
jgi:hypothetical protein